MPTPDLIQGVSLPTMGDPPAVPTDLANTWYAAIGRGVPRFSSIAQRDAAYSSPADGQYCYVGGAEKAFYVGNSGWKLHTRTAALPDPASSYVAGIQSITADAAAALPTPVQAVLTVPHPMLVRVELSATFGAGTTAAATIYAAQLTLSGSGAGVTLTPEANVRCLSGLSSPINAPGTLVRTVKATAAGTLTVNVFGQRLSPAAGSVSLRGVELNLTPLRWV